MNKKVKNILKTLAFPVLVFGIMDLLVRLKTGHGIISSMIDVQSIIRNAGISTILALALAFNLTSGRLDLSLGAQRLAGTIIGGSICQMLGLSGVWLLVFALAFGFLFGFLTGLAFVITRVPPMVLGVGMGLIWEVIPFAFTGGKGLNLYGMQGNAILNNTYFIIIGMVVIAIFCALLMNNTRFGYELKAIQGNQLIAQNSGINIFKNAVICYTFAGGLVCIGGMFTAAYETQLLAGLGLASNGVVTSNMFPMMLGAFIGLWSNDAIGTIVAALTIQIFQYGLTQLEFSTPNTNAINQGLFVLFLVFLANKEIFKIKAREKARIAEAREKKARMAEEKAKLAAESAN